MKCQLFYSTLPLALIPMSAGVFLWSIRITFPIGFIHSFISCSLLLNSELIEARHSVFPLPQCLSGRLTRALWPSMCICWLTERKLLYQQSLCVLLPGMVRHFCWSAFWLHTVTSRGNSRFSMATPPPSTHLPGEAAWVWVKNKIEYQDTISLCTGGALGRKDRRLGSTLLVFSLDPPPSREHGLLPCCWCDDTGLGLPGSPCSGPSCDQQWWAVICKHPMLKGGHRPKGGHQPYVSTPVGIFLYFKASVLENRWLLCFSIWVYL